MRAQQRARIGVQNENSTVFLWVHHRSSDCLKTTDRTIRKLRAQEKNKSPILLVFASVYSVASTGKYPYMHQRIRLVDEPKSGAIWWNYFFPAP
jgi:hypothetical protein